MTTRRSFDRFNLKQVDDYNLHFALLCDTPFLLCGATHPALLFTASLLERPQAVPSPLSERGCRGCGLDVSLYNELFGIQWTA